MANIRDVRVTGGAGSNKLRVTGWDGNAVLDGGQGSDEFRIEAPALDAVTLADAGGTLDQLTLVGSSVEDIENVSTSSGNDSFTFVGSSASLAGNLNAGGGSDTLDFSSRTASVSVDLGESTATTIGGTFSGIEVLKGSAGTDTLTGPGHRQHLEHYRHQRRHYQWRVPVLRLREPDGWNPMQTPICLAMRRKLPER